MVIFDDASRCTRKLAAQELVDRPHLEGAAFKANDTTFHFMVPLRSRARCFSDRARQEPEICAGLQNSFQRPLVVPDGL